MFRKITSVFLSVCVAASVLLGTNASAEYTVNEDSILNTGEQNVTQGDSYSGTPCVVLSGSNSEAQNYSSWASPRRSAAAMTADGGFMTVTKDSSSALSVMYYNSSYQLTGFKSVSLTLPIYGGFFASSDGYYYVATGQNNLEENDSLEVYRITKYNSSWTEISHASLYGANTYHPFDAGSCDFAEYEGYLLVRTCHEMYASSDGYHHQANVTIQIKKSDMSVAGSFYGVANIGVGYASHSFNQYIREDGGYAVTVDHGDAYPRSIVLGRYNTAINNVIVDGWNKRFTNIDALTIPGSIGANATGVSVGGFEYSDSAYLIAVNTVDMSAEYNAYGTRNAAVIVVPKSGSGFGTPVLKTLTGYSSGEKGVNTPQLVKTGSNSFIMLWSRNGTVYYTKLDGNGNSGTVYSFDGALSDCRPIVYGSSIMWYVYNNENTVFYRINTSSLSDHSSTKIITGHNYEYMGTENATARFVCSKCNDTVSKTVPTGFTIYGKLASETGSYWTNYYNKKPEVGDALLFIYSFEPSNTDDKTVEVIAEDPRLFEYDDSAKKLIAKSPGTTNVTFRLKYNPTVSRTVALTVNGTPVTTDIASCTFSAISAQTYTGSAITPAVTVTYGTNTLRQDTDYIVTYSDNVDIGTAAKVTITGIGSYSGTKTLTFSIVAPNIPHPAVTAKAGDGTITLSWKAVTGATQYSIKRYDPTNNTLIDVKTGYTGTELKINGLTNGVEYTYLVQACVSGLWSEYTEKDFVSAIPFSSVPVVTATPGDGEVTLSWTAVTNATKYAINRYNPSTKKFKCLKSAFTGTELKITGLSNGYEYVFLVQAYVNDEWSSADEKYFVYATPFGATEPVVTATPGDGSVTLSWKAISGATKYAVNRYNPSTKKFKCLQSAYTGTSITIAELSNGYEYTFLVQAYVNGAWSSADEQYFVSATPFGAAEPIVTATPGNGSVTLSWKAIRGATKYAINRYNPSTKKFKCLNAAYNGTEITVTGLSNGYEYTFLVQAYVNGNWSSADEAYFVSATPFGASEPVVTATPGDGEVTLAWRAVPNATKYAINRYNPATGKFKCLQAAYYKTEITVSGLANGYEYVFLVQANVNGTWSSADEQFFVYATPSGSIEPVVTATAGNGEVTLSWTAVKGATKYAINRYNPSTKKFKCLQAAYNGTDITISGLANGYEYIFLVQAYVNGAWSSADEQYFVYATPGART